MARPLRVDFPGAIHHVMNRVARRAELFDDPVACELFVQVLAELPERFGVRIRAFALMPNHYHLLLECPRGNLSRAMKHLGAEFTQRLNRRRGWDGALFRGRFKSRIVSGEGYLARLYAYIHQNPVRAGLAPDLSGTRLTSHRALVGLERVPEWLDKAAFMDCFGTVTAYLTYVGEVDAGEAPDPPGWDSSRLWTPDVAPVHVSPEHTPHDPDVLMQTVAAVMLADVEANPSPATPRDGALAQTLAAWWLSCNLDVNDRTIGTFLGCGAATVSRLRRRARGPAFASWRRRLREAQAQDIDAMRPDRPSRLTPIAAIEMRPF